MHLGRHIVESALVCALDVEWKPQSKPACATLLQLALGGAGSRHVLLLASPNFGS